MTDILRIEDNKNLLRNPQTKNIYWLANILTPFMPKNYFLDIVCGDEGGIDSIRYKFYENIGLDLSTNSWAYTYEGKDNSHIENLCDLISNKIATDVVIGYELSPLLIKALSNIGITYIDLTIHPIRFLDDYFFGMRSNSEKIREVFKYFELKNDVIEERVSLLKAKGARLIHDRQYGDSALFFGQTIVDAALIKDQRMCNLADLENALIETNKLYDRVYFKPHPHAKNMDELKRIVTDTKCKWLDINAYDALGHDDFKIVSSISSGTLIEAKYFGKPTLQYLKNKEEFNYINYGNEDYYFAVYRKYFSSAFWDMALNHTEIDLNQIVISETYMRAIKETLGVKWAL